MSSSSPLPHDDAMTRVHPVFARLGFGATEAEVAFTMDPGRRDLAEAVRTLWQVRLGADRAWEGQAAAGLLAGRRPDLAARALIEQWLTRGFSRAWYQEWLGHMARLGRGDLRLAGREMMAQRLPLDWARVKSAETTLTAGDPAGAIAILDQILTISRGHAHVSRLILSASLQAEGRAAYALRLEAMIEALEEEPKLVDLAPLADLEDATRVKTVLERIVARWPAIRLGPLRRFVASDDAAARDPAVEIMRLRLAGEDQAAQALYTAQGEVLGQARSMLDLALALGPARGLQREMVALEREDEVLYSPRGPGDQVVFAFLGLGLSPNGPQVAHIDLALAQRGVSAVYLSDPHFAAFYQGVPALGRDWAETSRALQAYRDKIGAARAYTMGFSVGSMGAFTHGFALPARAMLLFSPPTTSDPARRAALGDRRGPSVADKINGSGVLGHLPAWYDQTQTPPRALVHIGEDSLVDVRLTGLLAEKPGVQITTHPAPCGHRVWLKLMREGSFGAALDQMLAL